MFEPLLLEECAAQMLRGQEEGQVLTSQVRCCAGHHVAQTRCIIPRHSQTAKDASCWRHGCSPMLLLPPLMGMAVMLLSRAPPYALHLPPSCWPILPTTQPAVVAAAQTRPEDESLLVRLTMPAGVSSTFHENDMMLVSRDNPEVGRDCAGCMCTGPCMRVPMLLSGGRMCRSMTTSELPKCLASVCMGPLRCCAVLRCRMRTARSCTMLWARWRGTRARPRCASASSSQTRRRRATRAACSGAWQWGWFWRAVPCRTCMGLCSHSLHCRAVVPARTLVPQPPGPCSCLRPDKTLSIGHSLAQPASHAPASPAVLDRPRCPGRAKSMRHSLAKPESQWYVLKLSSMSTIMREWAAIHCIAHMPLREVLLTAKVRRCVVACNAARTQAGWQRAGTLRCSHAALVLGCGLRALHASFVCSSASPTRPPSAFSLSCCLQPSQSLLAARGKLEVPPLMRAQMEKTYNESQVGAALGGCDGVQAIGHAAAWFM